MSQDDKDWITYNHNKKRAEVAKGETYGQPGASNMNALVIISLKLILYCAHYLYFLGMGR